MSGLALRCTLGDMRVRAAAFILLLGLLTPAGSAVLCGWNCAHTDARASASRAEAGCHEPRRANADLQLANAGDPACHDRVDGVVSLLTDRPAPLLPAPALTHRTPALPALTPASRLRVRLGALDPPDRLPLTPLRI